MYGNPRWLRVLCNSPTWNILESSAYPPSPRAQPRPVVGGGNGGTVWVFFGTFSGMLGTMMMMMKKNTKSKKKKKKKKKKEEEKEEEEKEEETEEEETMMMMMMENSHNM